ncbi:hypothetical protein P8452_13464 [Trifolium repens]|nr:hypothetical protein P8452_13464 [Trifolium repens]
MESLYIDPIGDQPAESEKTGNNFLEVCASVKLDSSFMQELVEWNELFGEGGSGSQNNRHLRRAGFCLLCI